MARLISALTISRVTLSQIEVSWAGIITFSILQGDIKNQVDASQEGHHTIQYMFPPHPNLP